MGRRVLIPEWVGLPDGSDYYVGGPHIAALHGVDIRECVYGDSAVYCPEEGDTLLYPTRIAMIRRDPSTNELVAIPEDCTFELP